MTILPTDAIDRKTASKLKALRGKIDDIYPSQQDAARVSSAYVPGIGKWGDDGIVPTAPFSGEATAGLLQKMAEVDPKVARQLSTDEGIRKIIGQKIDRDTAAGGAREDIQNTRKFLKDADWQRAVAMIRKGMAPAAALTAMGYNINAMAADSDETP